MSQPSGTCPVCKKTFTKEDKVVVCPSCGAPYHRDCYNKAGQCVFTSRHGSGFEYSGEPQKPEESAGKGTEKQSSAGQTAGSHGLKCLNCGTINDANHIFCERCGAPLHREFSDAAQKNAQAPPGGNGTAGQDGGPGFWGMGTNAYGPAAVNMAGKIDGIEKADWARFIGTSAPTYLQRLSQQQARNSKVSFMISPFFLGPFYFAYRKMWGWAVLSFLVLMLLAVPSYILLLHDAGVPMSWLNVSTMETIQYISTYVSLGVQLVLGLFGLHLFRRHAVKKIQAIQQVYTLPQEYEQALVKKGGISVVGVVLAVAAYMGLYMAFISYFGAYLIPYLTPLL